MKGRGSARGARAELETTSSRRAFLAGAVAVGAQGVMAGCASTGTRPTWPAAAACAPGTCTFVDVHCHIFNGADLPIGGFLSHQLAPAPEAWTRPLANLMRGEIARFSPGVEELDTLANAFSAQAPVVPSAASRALQEIGRASCRERV